MKKSLAALAVVTALISTTHVMAFNGPGAGGGPEGKRQHGGPRGGGIHESYYGTS